MAASQDFDGSTEYIAKGTTGPQDVVSFPCAFACWFNCSDVTGGSKYVMDIYKSGNYLGMRINSSNITMISSENSTTARIEVCGTISNDTWYHCVINWVSSTERTLYLDGAQYGSTNTESSDPITYGFDRAEVGGIGTSSVFFPGPTAMI